MAGHEKPQMSTRERMRLSQYGELAAFQADETLGMGMDFEILPTMIAERFAIIAFSKPLPQPARHFSTRYGKTTSYIPKKKSKVYDYRADVRAAARKVFGRPIAKPAAIQLSIYFCFRRPASHFRTGKHAEQLKPTAPQRHCIRPDTDNLLKSTVDAIKGVAFEDDSQVFRITNAVKVWLRDRNDREQVRILLEVLQ